MRRRIAPRAACPHQIGNPSYLPAPTGDGVVPDESEWLTPTAISAAVNTNKALTEWVSLPPPSTTGNLLRGKRRFEGRWGHTLLNGLLTIRSAKSAYRFP